MKIICLGGGPAGLYFAISMKLRRPDWHVRVMERNRAGDTFGWGVVFSDQTLANVTANDPVSAATISDSFAHWEDIDIIVGADRVSSTGHGFIGIGRKRLLTILQNRARELDVDLVFETECSDDLADYAAFDLIVAADGVNSRIRALNAARFDVDIQTRANKFMWLGTTRLFDAFAFIFEKTEHGWVWAHAYRFDETHSTFIIECSEATWRGLGFNRMEQPEAIDACQRIFVRHLEGHPLITNAAHLRGSAAWINFKRVLCNQWSFDNVVLLGDAAHTAHFSIGSGTKLALEDAIKLATVLDRADIDSPGTLSAALADYQQERQIEVLKIQNSARNSTEWFETLDRYLAFEPPQFAYSLLTRSQRVSHENLRQRDPAWLSSVEQWFRRRALPDAAENHAAPPPMFTPLRLRELALPNRVVMSPILTYEADADGTPNDFHLVHYGTRALGGAGLIVTEMAAVSPEGRVSPACPGLWTDAQTAAWRRIVGFVHANSDARICAQIGHAGARGSTQVPVDGRGFDQPLASGGWDLLSASDRPWKPGGKVPRAITHAEMEAVAADFVATARRADLARFDAIEIQAGHGFLLSSFITPLMNHRTDEYGGSLPRRLAWPRAVIRAVRAAWPQHKPLFVRISATDWAGLAGITPDDAVEIARAFKEDGVDLIDVSAGETTPDARPVYGRMFQTPLSDQIRNEAGCRTMAVGNITEADQANSILAAGRADLVAIGRPHLVEPMWMLHAAARSDHTGVKVPSAYAIGQAQLVQTLRRPGEILAG